MGNTTTQPSIDMKVMIDLTKERMKIEYLREHYYSISVKKFCKIVSKYEKDCWRDFEINYRNALHYYRLWLLVDKPLAHAIYKYV